jgi:hypothetical protein
MQALTDRGVRHHQKISKDSNGPIIDCLYDLLLLALSSRSVDRTWLPVNGTVSNVLPRQC